MSGLLVCLFQPGSQLGVDILFAGNPHFVRAHPTEDLPALQAISRIDAFQDESEIDSILCGWLYDRELL